MIEDVIYKFKKLDALLQAEKTGTRSELINTLGIGKSQLYYYFNLLKDYGADIRFSRIKKSYYYFNTVEVDIAFSVTIIDDSTLLKCTGGLINSIINCRVQFIKTM